MCKYNLTNVKCQEEIILNPKTPMKFQIGKFWAALKTLAPADTFYRTDSPLQSTNGHLRIERKFGRRILWFRAASRPKATTDYFISQPRAFPKNQLYARRDSNPQPWLRRPTLSSLRIIVFMILKAIFIFPGCDLSAKVSAKSAFKNERI